MMRVYCSFFTLCRSDSSVFFLSICIILIFGYVYGDVTMQLQGQTKKKLNESLSDTYPYDTQQSTSNIANYIWLFRIVKSYFIFSLLQFCFSYTSGSWSGLLSGFLVCWPAKKSSKLSFLSSLLFDIRLYG